jgi:hypothetical protein
LKCFILAVKFVWPHSKVTVAPKLSVIILWSSIYLVWPPLVPCSPRWDPQHTWRRLVKLWVNDELKSIVKDLLIAYSRYCYGIRWKRPRKIAKVLKYDGLCAGMVLNWAPP